MPRGRFSPDIFSGARFGKLVVVKRISKTKSHVSQIKCRCDCGATKVISADELRKHKSCGCSKYDGIKRANQNKAYTIKEGDVFSRLTVVKINSSQGGKVRRNVDCICSCGNKVSVRKLSLVHGQTKSCGCRNSEVQSKKTTERNKRTAKFGGFSAKCPRTYITWMSMRNRCLNPKQKGFQAYGKKGVIICQFLRERPQNLIKILGAYKKRMTLDRYPIHNGNYTCGSCQECKRNSWELNIRWATRKEQALNRGNFNVFITAFKMTLTLSQWSELTGIRGDRLRRRMKAGWDPERIVSTPNAKGCFYDPGSGTASV